MMMYASTEVKLQMMKQCVRPMVTTVAALCMLPPVFFAMMDYWFVSLFIVVVKEEREQKVKEAKCCRHRSSSFLCVKRREVSDYIRISFFLSVPDTS
eukprot:scaffold29797_cov35-Cyclotella_meneghiniana.AAC.1